jgi:CRP/FNR family transcriptional regulator, cyclic AMP receptor protein
LSTHAVPPHPDPSVPPLTPRRRHAAPLDDHVALLEADPAFAAAIPAADLALATRVLCVPRLYLPHGGWSPPDRASWPAPTTALMLLEGLVVRHVALGGRVSAQLLGPSDVLDPWVPGTEVLPCGVRWSVHETAGAAVLDGRFATAARRWPGLSAVVHERLATAAARLGTHLAICQLPRVEERVLALLWHLAERFGRVASGGVVLPLRLTHRLVGELAGAQRPTVTLAFAALQEDGRVTRREDGSLLLAAGSYAGLRPSVGPAPAPEPAERVPALREAA